VTQQRLSGRSGTAADLTGRACNLPAEYSSLPENGVKSQVKHTFYRQKKYNPVRHNVYTADP